MLHVFSRILQTAEYNKWVSRARTREQAGMWDDARECWQKAEKSVDKDSPSAQYCRDQVTKNKEKAPDDSKQSSS